MFSSSRSSPPRLAHQPKRRQMSLHENTLRQPSSASQVSVVHESSSSQRSSSSKFTQVSSDSLQLRASHLPSISSALFFTLAVTWLLAPFAMLLTLPLVKRLGWFWAEILGSAAGYPWA